MLGSRLATIALAATSLVLSPALAEDWSRFRGPNGSGISSSVGLPTDFGPDRNQLWAAPVPFGRSSPVIGGDRLFLTAVEDGKLVTLAFDRTSGELLWRRAVERRQVADLHADTDSSTPTPATDGTNVYVFFHESGLLSYDASGKERWRLELGPFRNYYGCSASPIVARDLVLAMCDQAEGSFILAVDSATGKERWRRNRPARLESYATPILYPATGTPELVLVSGSRWVDAYHVESGKSAWTVPGVGTSPIASPVLVGDMLYVCAIDLAENGWPDFGGLLSEHDADGDQKLSREEVAEAWLSKHFGWLDTDADGAIETEDWKRLGSEVENDSFGIYAIRLPGDPESEPEIVWNYRQNIPYIPSPLVYEGVFYMVKDSIVSSLDAKTGELIKRDRLGSGAKVYASPVAADGKILIGTLDGHMAVLDAAGDWKVLADNELGEPIHASPAILDGRLYVRTKSRLYAFGSASEVKSAAP